MVLKERTNEKEKMEKKEYYEMVIKIFERKLKALEKDDVE